MNIDIDKLNKEDKISLLKKLMYEDNDTKPFVQAVFTEKINYVLDRFDTQLEKYFKEQDEENERIHRNMWKTTRESWVLSGIGQACSKIKRILTEIKNTKFDDCYDSVFQDIHNAKNRIIDNQISQRARGTRAYHTILKYEGQIADILEHIWSYAFNLGTLCRARTLTQDEIDELDKSEKDMAYQISTGSYDRDRIWHEVISYISEDDDERKIRQTMNMIPLNPDEHPEVIDFLKKL